MCGYVGVIGPHSYKRVEVDEMMHNVYVAWLIEDVLPTLERSDCKKGSLAEWHQVCEWEKQLTASIRVTPERVMLDISDSFCIDAWVSGFLSLDLSICRIALALTLIGVFSVWHSSQNGFPSLLCVQKIDNVLNRMHRLNRLNRLQDPPNVTFHLIQQLPLPRRGHS